MILPPTSLLLNSGGDARMRLDPHTGRNRYGCGSLPDPELLAFGSSTASTISPAGYAAAERLRERLQSSDLEPAACYAAELERQRDELRRLCALNVGTDIVFAASGTELHLIAGQLFAAADASPVVALLAEDAETGSSVPAAVCARHFVDRTPSGATVLRGSDIEGRLPVSTIGIRLRDDEGQARPPDRIDAEFSAHAELAIASGQRVLLVLTDVSKSGLVAPGLACALALRDRYPERLGILVDACQFRLSPPALNRYLAHGCMVAVTGSKFLGGPSFSGALLLPPPLCDSLRLQVLPPALQPYCNRAEWPADWQAAVQLPNGANFGLLLRLEAAINELRAFIAIPETALSACLARCVQTIQARLRDDPSLCPLDLPALPRNDAWDALPTLFPFTLTHDGRPLDFARAHRIFQLMLDDLGTELGPLAAPRCQLGQPIHLGAHGAALRLCLSAPQLARAATSDQAEQALLDAAMRVLDKAALLVRHPERYVQ
jgi:hypothetical protein